MISQVGFKNFKCFKNPEKIDLTPVTILCGTNSSGKSSIINSILTQKQSYEGLNISNKIVFNGALIKNGKYTDIAFQGSTDNIELSMGYVLEEPSKRISGRRNGKYEIDGYNDLKRLFCHYVRGISKFNVRCTIEACYDESEAQINNNRVYSQTIEIDSINTYGNVKLSTQIKVKQSYGKLYKIEISNLPLNDELQPKITLSGCNCYFDNMRIANIFANNISPNGLKYEEVINKLISIFQVNSYLCRSVKYIAPLRDNPKLYYGVGEEVTSLGISGEMVPQFLSINDEKNTCGFNPPQNNNFQKETELTVMKYSLSKWMEYIGLGKYEVDSNEGYISLRINGHLLPNVGFGVSQVLPILIMGLRIRENETLLLEQPEIHLHPKAQMGIADFLISIGINKKGCIVETHSDHIINRIIRRMMENKEIAKLVKIYFVNQNEGGESSIEEVLIDPIKGAMIENEDFFYQFANETEQIIEIGYKNKTNQG